MTNILPLIYIYKQQKALAENFGFDKIILILTLVTTTDCYMTMKQTLSDCFIVLNVVDRDGPLISASPA